MDRVAVYADGHYLCADRMTLDSSAESVSVLPRGNVTSIHLAVGFFLSLHPLVRRCEFAELSNFGSDARVVPWLRCREVH